nr:peroxiredoxin [Thermofilum pendens]
MSGVVSVGEQAPDFEAESTGGVFRLSSLRGRRVVLFFFPKAFTPGCSRELSEFSELYEEFKRLGAEVVGVSADKVNTLRKFAKRYNAAFNLVSDPSLEVAGKYGVVGRSGKTAERVTFVIDEQGVVRAVLRDLPRAEDHPHAALEALKSLAGQQP